MCGQVMSTCVFFTPCSVLKSLLHFFNVQKEILNDLENNRILEAEQLHMFCAASSLLVFFFQIQFNNVNIHHVLRFLLRFIWREWESFFLFIFAG